MDITLCHTNTGDSCTQHKYILCYSFIPYAFHRNVLRTAVTNSKLPKSSCYPAARIPLRGTPEIAQKRTPSLARARHRRDNLQQQQKCSPHSHAVEINIGDDVMTCCTRYHHIVYIDI